MHYACQYQSLMFSHLQALCINDAVLRLGSAPRINERCMDLQKAKPKKQAVAQAGDGTRVSQLPVVSKSGNAGVSRAAPNALKTGLKG